MPGVDFSLNGQPVHLDVSPGTSALDALRELAGVTSLKDGCNPQGACGCCTALWDGVPVMTCSRSAESLHGAHLVTLEGLDEHKRRVLARSFTRAGALQCGYCTPGIALRTAAMLDRDPNPAERKIRALLTSHICRCTGYTKLFTGVADAAGHWEGPEPSPCDSAHDRYQGEDLVLGQRPFVNDLSVPGMLHAALVLSQHPRARVLSIDPSAALAMPGVCAVITARDVPGQRDLGQLVNDWPVYVGVGELTHCVASAIAAVAATTRHQARVAAAAVRVEYEVLPPVTDPELAMGGEAPQVHAGRGNLFESCTVRRADVDEALGTSAHVIEQTFRTQRVEHAFLEPESCLAVPTETGLTVYTQGQGVHEDRRQIARALGWPEDRVLVVLVPNGGGFGGKEDLSVQQHAALLAARLGQAVKLTLSRDESIQLHPKRHPFLMHYTVGCDAQGVLTAVRARIIGDTGGYLSVGSKVMERAAGHACGPYRVPAVDVIAHTVYTNNPPSGAFRGFGVNQTSFAIEGMLDRLAERVGIDGYQIRDRNILGPGDAFATGQRMDAGIGIRQTLDALRPDYEAARAAGRKVGLACGIKNTGLGNGLVDTGRVLIRVEAADRVVIHTGFTEMGQGLFTVLRGIVHEQTGIEPGLLRVVTSTEHAVECGMTTASRATLLTTEAALRACDQLRTALAAEPLAQLVGRSFAGEFSCNFTVPPGTPGDHPVTHVTFGYATQMVLLDDEGRLERVVAAHDVGRVMNRVACEGQIEGSIHMGLGQALTEDLPTTDGYLDSTRLVDLQLIRARHVPAIEVRLLQVPDPHTEYGVKGVGEIGLVPTAGAVAAALHAHDGIWRHTLPMRGSAAARAILARQRHEPDHP